MSYSFKKVKFCEELISKDSKQLKGYESYWANPQMECEKIFIQEKLIKITLPVEEAEDCTEGVKTIGGCGDSTGRQGECNSVNDQGGILHQDGGAS